MYQRKYFKPRKEQLHQRVTRTVTCNCSFSSRSELCRIRRVWWRCKLRGWCLLMPPQQLPFKQHLRSKSTTTAYMYVSLIEFALSMYLTQPWYTLQVFSWWYLVYDDSQFSRVYPTLWFCHLICFGTDGRFHIPSMVFFDSFKWKFPVGFQLEL